MKGMLALALTLALASTAADAARKVETEQGEGGNGGTGQQSPVGGMSDNETLSCTVALCMANPNGWNALQECRDPVEKWLDRKRRGKSTPPCPGLSSNDDGGGEAGGGGGSGGGNQPQVPQQQQ